MDNGLTGLLGLCRRAGKAELGEEPTAIAALSHKARLILVASDAADNTRRKAESLGAQGNAPVLTLPLTKQELGGALGRASCAVLALTDMGLAATVAQKLSQADPARCGDVAQALGQKAAKQDRRRKEQRAKEKARLSQSRKPWATPPKAGNKT